MTTCYRTRDGTFWNRYWLAKMICGLVSLVFSLLFFFFSIASQFDRWNSLWLHNVRPWDYRHLTFYTLCMDDFFQQHSVMLFSCVVYSGNVIIWLLMFVCCCVHVRFIQSTFNRWKREKSLKNLLTISTNYLFKLSNLFTRIFWNSWWCAALLKTANDQPNLKINRIGWPCLLIS